MPAHSSMDSRERATLDNHLHHSARAVPAKACQSAVLTTKSQRDLGRTALEAQVTHRARDCTCALNSRHLHPGLSYWISPSSSRSRAAHPLSHVSQSPRMSAATVVPAPSSLTRRSCVQHTTLISPYSQSPRSAQPDPLSRVARNAVPQLGLTSASTALQVGGK
jgi:hypothetical protein